MNELLRGCDLCGVWISKERQEAGKSICRKCEERERKWKRDNFDKIEKRKKLLRNAE